MSQIYRLVCPIISKRNIESIYIYSESHSLTVSFSVDGRARGTFRQCCQIGLPFEDVQTVLPDWATFWGRSAVLPDWATFWGRSAVLPDWATFEDVQQCCQIGLPFEDVQTVLPDWATFWGRSDRVARLGYFLRTFRQCCQIGLPFEGRSDSVARLGYLLRTFRQCCQIGLLFEDVSAVLLLLQLLLLQLLVLLIQLLLLFQVLLLFQLLLQFKLLLLFQILLLFQLLLLLSDSSTISASTTTFRFFYYFSFYYYFQILQINSFMLCNYRSASSIHTRFLQEMHFLVIECAWKHTIYQGSATYGTRATGGTPRNKHWHAGTSVLLRYSLYLSRLSVSFWLPALGPGGQRKSTQWIWQTEQLSSGS